MITLKWGKEKAWTLQPSLVAFAVVTAPILQNYKGIINAGVTVIILALPFVLLAMIRKGEGVVTKRSLAILSGVYLFQLFKIIDHGTSVSEIGLAAVYFLYTTAYFSKCLDPKRVISGATVIASIASVLIIVQYICYYLFHFHLKLVPTSLFLESASKWIALAKTGKTSITGQAIAFYRPSAFFMEPSHMAIYLSGPLLYQLFSSGKGFKNKRIAILLSAGILLSTSGMGIVAVVISWFLYFAKKSSSDSDDRLSLMRLLQPKVLIVVLGIVIILVAMYFKLDFFHRSVNRIFRSGSDYTNAVSGRVKSGTEFIRQMKGRQLFIGISDHYSDVDFHMSGFNATMYKFGIIGTLLSYLFYFGCLKNLKGKYFWFAMLLIGLSFFTPHTHGTFYMLFFIVFLIDGYHEKYQTADSQQIGNKWRTRYVAFNKS